MEAFLRRELHLKSDDQEKRRSLYLSNKSVAHNPRMWMVFFPQCGIILYKRAPTTSPGYHMTARGRRNMALFSRGTAHHVSNNCVENQRGWESPG